MGEIANFTGISSPYEYPINPELTLDTAMLSIDDCVARVIMLLEAKGLIAGSGESMACSRKS